LLILCANVPEHMLVGNPEIRAVCAKRNLAIVWSTPSFMNFKRTEPGKKKMSEEWDTTVAFLQQQLDGLAATSGYAEIATAPWLPLGESGHLLMVDALVETKPERCIAGVWIKNSHLPPRNRTTPALVIYGTAQEWGQDKTDIRSQWQAIGKTYDGILNQRKKNPQWPFSYLIDGHSGHFDCSPRLTSYIAHYLDRVVAARLPSDGSATLHPIEMATGFVADLPVPGHTGKPVEPATPTAIGPWFIDRESAEEAQAFAAINWQAQTQFPGYLDDQGKILPYDFNGITNLKTVTTEADGLTFTVRGALNSTIPAGFAHAGEPLAQGPGTPVPEWLCGPLEPLGDGRFRIALDRVWLGGGATYVALRQAGTDAIRGIVQPAGVDLRGMRSTTGKPQKITFTPLADVRIGAPPITLQATSDAGLPVSYFVVAGPAEVRDGKLAFTSLPPRTKLPVTVTVAAWQWGRKAEPAVKMAEIVRQTVRVVAGPEESVR
jgi:hypothetical protein